MSEENVAGVMFSDAWFLNLAKKAHAEGWKVLNEWEALCPSCKDAAK
jgi:hypothetical protein